jgi:4-carboxymuconolactone decarboxylase
MALSTEERMREGARVRRQVLGAEYVDRGQQASDAFYDHFTEFTTEHCWGNVWLRPGLDYKTRSMLNLAMLAAMARWHEFAVHVRGALNNGVSEDEIAEILLQAGVYAGVPIAAEGFRTARDVIKQYRSEKK